MVSKGKPSIQHEVSLMTVSVGGAAAEAAGEKVSCGKLYFYCDISSFLKEDPFFFSCCLLE